MSKGGRYLKPKEKKGRGLKILVSVLLVLVLIVGGLYVFRKELTNLVLGPWLDQITRAEYENKDISDDELQSIMDFNPDKPTGEVEATVPSTTASVTTESTTQATQ